MDAVVDKINKQYVPRQAERKRVRLTLEMQDSQTSQIVGRVLDLSIDGFMLLAKQEVKPNQQYEFILNLSEAIKFNKTIQLTVECRWCQPSNTAGYFGAGFTVSNVAPMQRESWKQLVDEF